MERSINRVLVIGLGLIGGSFAGALKKRHLVADVVGYDRKRSECEAGMALGFIDRIADDLEYEVRNADMIVLGVPVKVMEVVLEQIAPWVSADALLTDVGSTKTNLVTAAQRLFNPLPAGFVPGHPIAGAERSGVAAADPELFVHHKVILTPLTTSSDDATMALARLWQGVGAEVLQMDYLRHDQVLAATSHLPHLLAFSLVDTLAQEEKNTDIFRYAAGGFRDFTRIAASDPTMWHDICFANRDQVLAQIDHFTAGVARLRAAIAAGDSEKMLGIFTRAKAARERFSRILARSAYVSQHDCPNWQLHVTPGGHLNVEPEIPGDRSISHRAILLAALADGITNIEGFFEAEDSLATLQALRDMGVVIEGPHQGAVRVYGVGLHGLRKPAGPVYCGRSSTSMRLLMGVLAAQSFDSELIGDHQLSMADMQPTVDALTRLGARIEILDESIRIHGTRLTAPVETLATESAQIKSALLLAGLYQDQPLLIKDHSGSRDHTERLLNGFGANIEYVDGEINLQPGTHLRAVPVHVPVDLSDAMFYILGATLTPDTEIELHHVGVNPTRTAVLDTLKRMGADVKVTSISDVSGEPVALLTIRSATLKGLDLSSDVLTRTLLDESPVLLTAMAMAEGESRIRLPESMSNRRRQRLLDTITALQKLGISILQQGDIYIINGGRIGGGNVSSGGDFRLACALAVVANVAVAPVTVRDAGAVATYFPEFVEQSRRAGLQIYKEEG